MKRNEVKKKSVISNKDCEWYCFIEYYIKMKIIKIKNNQRKMTNAY